MDSNKFLFDILSNYWFVISDKNNKLIIMIKDVVFSYVDKDDIFVLVFVGVIDVFSFLGDNKDNVDLVIFGLGNLLMVY